MKYRAEIDGLRALAVVPVILFHAGFELFGGGFVGVDVFFVISGYLITTILIEDMENKKFRISDFYERRARRILPPLYAVLFVCLLYSLYQAPFAARDLSQSITATVFFAQNILLYIESSNYFDLGSEFKPLLHMWTLGVEEQFYLVFPLLLLVLRIFGASTKFLAISFLAGLSFSLALWATQNSPSFSFFMLITRSWELMLGSLIALASRETIPDSLKRVQGFISMVGLSLIVFSFFFLNRDTPTPYLHTLLPTIGTATVIMFAHEGTAVNKLLSNRGFVGLGLISYGMYLWHQPIIVFYRSEVTDFSSSFSSFEAVVIFLVTIALSALSYFLIEKPFRNKKIVGRGILATSLLASSIVLVLVSFYGHKTSGFEDWKLAAVPAERRGLYISHAREVSRVTSSNWGQVNRIGASIVVIGDSMSADLQMSLLSVGVDTDRIDLDGSCFEELSKSGFACNMDFENLKSRVRDKQLVILASDFAKEHSTQGVKSLYDELSKSAKVMVMGSFRFKHASDMAYRFITSDELSPDSLFARNLDPRNEIVNRDIKSHIGNASFIDKEKLFCIEKECRLYDNDRRPLFYDSLHLTVEGWGFFGAALQQRIMAVVQ